MTRRILRDNPFSSAGLLGRTGVRSRDSGAGRTESTPVTAAPVPRSIDSSRKRHEMKRNPRLPSVIFGTVPKRLNSGILKLTVCNTLGRTQSRFSLREKTSQDPIAARKATFL